MKSPAKTTKSPYDYETERLILRNWYDADKTPFAELNRDPEVMTYLGGLRTAEQSARLVEEQIAIAAEGKPVFWVAEHKATKTFMGFIGVKEINFDAPFADPKPGYEIGWRLGKNFWGQGLVTEGAKAALSYAFEHCHMDNIWSFTVPENLASQKVMQNIGMARVENGDFAHPSLAIDDPLSIHVLYRIDHPK